MTGYRLTREASRHLDEIEDYTARRWGDDQASSYLDALFDAFERLAANPDLGRRRRDLPPPWLAYSVASHLVVYRSNDADARIEILAVWHPSMDVGHRITEALQRIPPPHR